MSYSWGGANFFQGDWNGQIYVDDLRRVYQWNATRFLWELRPHMVMKEVVNQILHTKTLTKSELLKNKDGLMSAQWDVIHTKDFVQVEDEDGTVRRRYALLGNRAGLINMLDSFLPGSPTYSANMRLRVFRVVDTSLTVPRCTAWNSLYGAMRGRSCYRGATRRKNLAISKYSGIDPKFLLKFETPPGHELQQWLVKFFVGHDTEVVTYIPESVNAVWFPSSPCDLAKLPSGDDGAAGARGGYGRYCYRADNGAAWVAAPRGTWKYYNTVLAVSPAALYVEKAYEAGRKTVHLSSMKEAQAFSSGLSDQRTIVAAYHVIFDADPDLHAFVLRPVGVDMVAADVEWDFNDWELFAVNKYGKDSGNVRYRKIEPVEDRTMASAGWRWSIFNAIDKRALNLGVQPWRASTARLPREIQFVARHKLTGVFTNPFGITIEVARRRPNMSVGFLVKKTGGDVASVAG